MGNRKHPEYLEKGMRFSKLTVICVDEGSKIKNGEVSKPVNWKYICKCDCGRTVSVLRWSLLEGVKVSCGCDTFKSPQYLQSGEIYNDWKIIGISKNGKLDSNGEKIIPQRWRYDCKCLKCGRIRSITKWSLFKGDKPPCICSNLIEVGRIFGRLTVLSLNDEANLSLPIRSWEYVCKCKCGKIISRNRTALMSGKTKSCGCLKKEKASKRKRPKNPTEDCGEYIKVFFFNDSTKYTLVDKDKYDLIKNYCWSYRKYKKTGIEYAISNTFLRTQGKAIGMHNILLPTEDGFVPDHIDGNGLNNRMSNLRPVTRSQNSMNKKLMSSNKSGTTGVWWVESRSRWVAELQIGGKKYTSYRKTFDEAVKARKILEENHFGEFSFENSRGGSDWQNINVGKSQLTTK